MIRGTGGKRQSMSTANELRAGLLALAKRSVGIATACSNLESTRLYLVLPFLGLLGYDPTDPFEVYPNHIAALDASRQVRVDFAVLRNAAPVIAVACRQADLDPCEVYPSLQRYFDLLPETKLAILTNGVHLEFYVDAVTPGVMDREPFLTLDLETIARAGVPDDSVEALLALTKSEFEPDRIAEAAHVALVRRRLRSLLIEEAKAPSDAFCRFAIESIGIGVPTKQAIDLHYAALIRSAFADTIAALSVEELRLRGKSGALPGRALLQSLVQRTVSIELELGVVAHVRRRLAYLVEDEAHYRAIEAIRYRAHVGRLAVYVEHERAGRMFDFIEGADGYDKYAFPEPFGEIVASDPIEIDGPLKTVFERRLRELQIDGSRPKLARRA